MAYFARAGNGVEAPGALASYDVIGVEKAADAVLASGYAYDQLVLDDQRGHRDAVTFHGVCDLCFPEGPPGAGIEGDEGCVEGSEEDAIAKDGDAAIVAIALKGVDLLLRTLILPDLHTGAGVECKDLPGHSRCVHDSIDDDWSGFENRIAWHLDGPLGLEVLYVGGCDLVEFGEVVACVIAPVGEPVLGFVCGVFDAVVGEGAGGNCCLDGLREIALVEGLEVGDDVF